MKHSGMQFNSFTTLNLNISLGLICLKMYMRHLALLGLGRTDLNKGMKLSTNITVIPNFLKPNTVPAAVTKSKRNNLLALTQTSLLRLK